MLTLWGRTNSSNVMKVLWTLDELGLAYERIDAGGPYGRTNEPEYRAMNPLGVVPTLVDNGFSVFESNVIIRYLCNAHAPNSPLYPAAAAPRPRPEPVRRIAHRPPAHIQCHWRSPPLHPPTCSR